MTSGHGGAEGSFPRVLLAADVVDAAHALLGALLIREPDTADAERRVARIVEVEAYRAADDRASHARMGPTRRNSVMFGPAGHAYVYLVYGMHHCLNIVAGPDGAASAVLIRAIEPVAGIGAMRAARSATRPGSRAGTPASAYRVDRLGAGPALVAACLTVDRTMTGLDLCDPGAALHLAAADAAAGTRPVRSGPRIGIAYAGEPSVSLPWRLALADSPSLSRPIA